MNTPAEPEGMTSETNDEPSTLASVANALIARGIKAGHPLTQQALHKLVYIVDAHHWAAHGRPGVDHEAKAWKFGPHYPGLLTLLEYQGNRAIRKLLDDVDPETGRTIREPIAKGAKIEAILDFVSQAYGLLTGPQLSDMTAKPGGAWERTRAARPEALAPGIPGEEAGRDYAHLVKAGDGLAAA